MNNNMTKYKVILDGDPGVDDVTCIIFALTDPNVNVELISIAAGNVPVKQATFTANYILDLLNKKVKVVRAKEKEIESATFMHGLNAIGGHKLPEKTTNKESREEVADAIYNKLKKYPHEITLLMCAPQTNIAELFLKYPDAPKLIKQIIFMGGSFGLPGQPDHISYNSRTAPEAFDTVIKSKVPITMVQSLIGRTKARFTERQVKKIAKMNKLGKFMSETFSTYWERGFKKKFVSNNDVCTYLYMVCPQMFKTEKIDLNIDCTNKIGKLHKKPNANSHITLITDLNRRKFLKFMFKRIKSLSNYDMNIK